MAAQAASCRGETSGTALTAGLGCRRVILAAAGARLSETVQTTYHNLRHGPREGPPSPGWPPGFLPGITWLGGQCPRPPLRSRQRGPGATAPSSRGTGEGMAGCRRQSQGRALLGLEPQWEAEALGAALRAWVRSSFPLHGLTAAGQPPGLTTI